MRVLIVDDEKLLADALKENLQKSMLVDVTYNGYDGILLTDLNHYDLIILDLVLPDISGVEVCRKIRKKGIITPILFITVKSGIKDIVSALDAGGDDYITKPFSYSELNARIRALYRRGNNLINTVILKAGDLKLDLASRKVIREGKEIFLRRKEFDLLHFMLKNQNHVLTRDVIIDHVWFNHSDLSSNTLDVHIKQLRDKVDKHFSKHLIKTIHGIGYMLENY
jgi:DNA-binding response OmpR family regulator